MIINFILTDNEHYTAKENNITELQNEPPKLKSSLGGFY